MDNVKARDEATYKCRVDFRQAPTRISNIDLNVIGKNKSSKFTVIFSHIEKKKVYLIKVDIISIFFDLVTVPPEKPRVYTVDDNKEVRLKLGPYRVGETVRVRYIMNLLVFYV